MGDVGEIEKEAHSLWDAYRQASLRFERSAELEIVLADTEEHSEEKRFARLFREYVDSNANIAARVAALKAKIVQHPMNCNNSRKAEDAVPSVALRHAESVVLVCEALLRKAEYWLQLS
jgi:hypothetical protein